MKQHTKKSNPSRKKIFYILLTILLAILIVTLMNMLIYKLMKKNTLKIQPQSFNTLAELKRSEWGTYIQLKYGSLPQKDDFPLAINQFSILDTDYLKQSDIDFPKRIPSKSTFPNNLFSNNACPMQNSDFYYNMSIDWEPPHSIWVAHLPPFYPIKSNTWVEVIHTNETLSKIPNEIPKDLLWLYIVKGSGIWLNVGKTISFQDHRDALDYFFSTNDIRDMTKKLNIDDKTKISTMKKEDLIKNYCGKQCHHFMNDIFDAAKGNGFDSIQFLSHSDQRCGNSAVELVYLKGDGNSTCGGKAVHLKTGWNHDIDCKCKESPSISNDHGWNSLNCSTSSYY